LIKEFYKITNIPVILNTSFNLKGEPIVCKPEEAYEDFIKTNMDYLVLENYLTYK
jgi:carbamoyltransferase